MIEFEPFRKNITPKVPNCIEEILNHPSGKSDTIRLALFNNHRFAFYFWNKWRLKCFEDYGYYKNVDLITYDWHQDLAGPVDLEKERLNKLTLDNLFEVNFYTSYKLDPLNDNHILSAAYLDIINDIWVLCRQGKFESHWEDKIFTDCNGKIHRIRKFKTEEELKKALFHSKVENVFFDIDLDYFTLNNNLDFEGKYKYMKNQEIKELLSLENDLIQWVFERVQGITIALEPEFTGGIRKSLKFLSIIEKLWFSKSIGNKSIEWNHLEK